MSEWSNCKNLLCVRLDNMGDLLMSAPAMGSLKDSFKCKITLLTSSMAAPMAEQIPVIDDTLIFDAPWVKSDVAPKPEAVQNIVKIIRERQFDGAIVFTVFSQNPMCAMLILWLSGIPRRAGYCRENPYELLTDWIPDPEPYQLIRHQVRRDLALVESLGAKPFDRTIPIRVHTGQLSQMWDKLISAGVQVQLPWIVLHPGVSESKREFPEDRWVAIGKKIVSGLNHQVVVTGGKREAGLAQRIAEKIGARAISVAGMLTLSEFILLIHQTPLVITVNTAAAHIAAATNTKVIVLYALTNPQHAPWKAIGKVMPYSVPVENKSKNEVLQFLHRTYFNNPVSCPAAEDVVQSGFELLADLNNPKIPELIGIENSVSV
jgi:ADP-heptose:LPS heptosyltransferase